jgi:broad specificity phosphatase PhoE
MKKLNLIIVALIVSIVIVLPINSAISFAETKSTGSTIVILVRHGETDWNELDILQGRANTTLNDVGITQMENLGASWGKSVGLDVDVVYSSPLLRARQSAEILCKYLPVNFPKIILDDNLQEMGLGILTGLPKSDLKSNSNYLDIYKSWLKDLNYAQPSGPAEIISEYTQHYLKGKEFSGESLNTVQGRAWNSLEKMTAKNKGKTILVSAHGGIIGLILCKVTDAPASHYSKFSIPNASTIILEFKNDGTVIWLNAPKS